MHAFACVDLALAIQRQMIGILRHQYVGEKAGTSKAACDRSARCRGLGNLLAVHARELLTYVTNDLVALGHILNHLAHIFSKMAQLTTTGRACTRALMHDLLARQMRRKGLPMWLLRRLFRCR